MEQSGVFRRKDHFIVSNHVLDNKNVSPQAFYIYSKICRYLNEEDFILTKPFLFSKCNMSDKTFDKYWKELLNEGYLKIYQIPDVTNKGKWSTEIDLLEEADLSSPYYTMFKSNGEPSRSLYPKSKSNNI